MIVDFHVHSTASDGTLPPRDLAERAVAGGFAAIALTDHDNSDGADEFMSAGSAANAAGAATRFVQGIELSIEPGETFDKFHLLGIGVDPGNEELKVFLRRVLEGRNERNRAIFENFRRIGIGDIAPEPHGEVLARPHFARWLVDHGYAESVVDAFQKYLLPESPIETRCYEERFHPLQEEAFRVIHGAGGLCVMAHPKYWRRQWKVVGPDYGDAERGLAALKEMGLDGLEAIYQANTQAENVGFAAIAARLGLLATAGSDFHGSNKPTISLGMDVEESFIAPFLERLASVPRSPFPVLT